MTQSLVMKLHEETRKVRYTCVMALLKHISEKQVVKTEDGFYTI